MNKTIKQPPQSKPQPYQPRFNVLAHCIGLALYGRR